VTLAALPRGRCGAVACLFIVFLGVEALSLSLSLSLSPRGLGGGGGGVTPEGIPRRAEGRRGGSRRHR
jgi:hypothetical protein